MLQKKFVPKANCRLLPRRGARDPCAPAALSGFGSGRIAWELPAYRCECARAGIDLLQRRELRRGETGIGIAAFAQQRRRIEVALAPGSRSRHLYSVQFVARCQRRRLNRGQFGGGMKLSGSSVSACRSQMRGGQQVSPIIGGRTGDDAVVVGRIALGFHQTPAVRHSSRN